jgi:hypothetical protein
MTGSTVSRPLTSFAIRSRPFPVPLRVYDETICVLKSAFQNARLGREEELGALQRLDQQARRLEGWAKGPNFEDVIAEEYRQSASYGGRAVFDWASTSETSSKTRHRSTRP